MVVFITHIYLLRAPGIVKALSIDRAFIRIITFHGEGDGHLFEARVLTNDI